MDLSEVGLIELGNIPAAPIMYTSLLCVIFVVIGAIILWNSTR